MATNWQRAGVEYIVKDSTRGGTAGVMSSLAKLEKASKGVIGSITRIGGSLAALAGVGSLAGITVLVRQQMEAVDAAAKWSDRLGIATEQLIGLQHAAELSGVGANQLNLGLQRMTRRVAEAAQGTGEAQDAIEELGLEASDLARKSPDEMFLSIADALGNVTNQSDRVRLAFKLFDSEGVAMVNILKAGREGIGAYIQDAEHLGLTLSRLDAAQIEAANDALTRAKAATQGLARQIALDLAPYIEGIADKFTEAAAGSEGFGDAAVSVLESVAQAGSKTLEVLESMVDIVTWLPGKVSAFGETAAIEQRARKRYRATTGESNAFGMKTVGFGAVPVLPKNPDLYQQLLAEEREIQAEAARSMTQSPSGRSGEIAAYFDTLRADAEQRRSEQRQRLEQQLSGMAAGPNTEGTPLGPAWPDIDYDAAYKGVMDYVKAQDQAADVTQKAKDRVAELDAQLDTSIEVTARMADGHAYAADQIAYEQAVWSAYGDDVAEATRLIEQHKAKLDELDTAQRRFQLAPLMSWTDVANKGLDELSGTLTDIAFDFQNAEKYAQQFVEQLARMAVQEMIMRPMLQGLQTKLGWGGEVKHTGGIIGSGPIETFHTGGVASDEVIAKLLKREVVLTERDAERLRGLGILNAQGRPNYHDGGVVGGSASVMPMGRSERPNVKVQVDNRTGSDVAADDVGVHIDPDEYIINVVLRNAKDGGAVRDLLRGGR